MTRKRFVKICMSHGMQRDYANACALSVSQYASYDELFCQIKPMLYWMPLRKSIKKAGASFKKIGRAAEELRGTMLDRFALAFRNKII